MSEGGARNLIPVFAQRVDVELILHSSVIASYCGLLETAIQNSEPMPFIGRPPNAGGERIPTVLAMERVN